MVVAEISSCQMTDNIYVLLLLQTIDIEVISLNSMIRNFANSLRHIYEPRAIFWS